MVGKAIIYSLYRDHIYLRYQHKKHELCCHLYHYNNILQLRAYDVLLVLFNSSLPNFLELTKLQNARNRLDIASRDLSFFQGKRENPGNEVDAITEFAHGQ